MRLSKSRFVAGWQCHRLLWWKVHEPGAVELQPDKVLQDRFDQGAQVGELARKMFAGGTLIDAPHHDLGARVALTELALESGAPAIFEASFVADDTFVAADVLTRTDDEWRLIEVKSWSSVKDEHIPDAAVQAHVLGRTGSDVGAVEIMHLNNEFRFPDEGPLFVRSDVTAHVRDVLESIPDEIEKQLEMLSGPIPKIEIGTHCSEPRDCPFMKRCWPRSPDHIANLAGIGPKTVGSYLCAGFHMISDIPPTKRLSFTQKRQIRAMKEGPLIVERGLAKALEPFERKLGFLDFETIMRVTGLAGHEAVGASRGTVQLPRGSARGWLHARRVLGRRTARRATGAGLRTGRRDGRRRAGRRVLVAREAADSGLRQAVPELAGELLGLEEKLIDLLPVIRDYVYHPDFRGNFSLKYVLTPMVPELSYNDLVIVDGLVASVEIARLLFVADKIAPEERDRVMRDLLDYCERDTWAMVRLLERVRGSGVKPA